MKTKTKAPISFFGSDAGVARELASFLDHCRHVTIPFFGGGSILPHLRAKAIVANDIHAAAINFYRVLSGREGSYARAELIRACEHTLSHPDELRLAAMTQHPDAAYQPHQKAWGFWAMSWIARKGKTGTRAAVGMPSVRWTANGGSNATRLRAAADDLEAWAAEFARCDWMQKDFRELLPKAADDPSCGIYVDAPWPNGGEIYLHPFTTKDHRDLAEQLARFERTTVVVRYGDDPLIRELYGADRWNIHEAEARTQSNKMRPELWIVSNPLRVKNE